MEVTFYMQSSVVYIQPAAIFQFRALRILLVYYLGKNVKGSWQGARWQKIMV